MHIANNVLNISLRFSFTNGDLVPKSIYKGGYLAKNHDDMIPGKLIMETTPNCSAIESLEFLEKDFLLVAANHAYEKHKDQTHNVVTFSFERSDKTTKKALGIDTMRDLKNLLSQSHWQICAFENPFYMNGVMIENKAAVSITLGRRQPLFDSKGHMLLQRPKNEQGRTVREAVAVPIKPDFILELTDETEEDEERMTA